MQPITIKDIEGFKIGNAQIEEAATGCTVILMDEGARTGVDIRGSAPATRETDLLNPLAANDGVHAIVLSGGSAYGLDASSGVMQYLEEKGIGFPTDQGVVPIVCSACLYDLAIGSSSIRPNAAVGYLACQNAEKNLYQDGSYGAGTGCSVGKMAGMAYAMKSGIATYALELGELKVGAIVAVNAAGDIYDKNGEIIAGAYDATTKKFLDGEKKYLELAHHNLFHTNTTLGAIITNANLSKSELTKLASMCQDSYARCIRPVHTMFDGDAIFASSTCLVDADLTTVAILATKAMEEAIIKAARPQGETYGLSAATSS